MDEIERAIDVVDLLLQSGTAGSRELGQIRCRLTAMYDD